MSEKDHRLEDFIRKGLGQPEFAFREEDWALMETKLDTLPMPVLVNSLAKIKWWIIGSVLFITSFFMGWFFKGISEENARNLMLAKLVENSIKNQEITIKGIVGENNLAGYAKTKSASLSVITKENKQSTSYFSINQDKVNKNINEDLTLMDDVREPLLILDETKSGLNLLFYKSWDLDYLKEGNIGAMLVVQKNKTELKDSLKEEKQPKKRNYHLALGLTASPDFTGTSIKKGFETMGETYGIGLEYYVGQRFRIKVAAYKTEKKYIAEKGEYSFPTSGAYYSQEPSSTDAVCNILEVPIMVHYQIWNLGRNKLWLSQGLSSYWMQREEYHYTYKNPSPNYPETALIEKQNKHLLSVFSLGFAYERTLSRNISLELEPYLKVPLGGVGYGKVTLYTTGLYLSLKYHIQSKVSFKTN